jgi:hypothetical protein
VFVTDGFDCINSTSFTITAPTDIVVETKPTDATLCGVKDGKVCLVITGGTPEYTVSISPSAGAIVPVIFIKDQENCITGLGAGTYNLTITDKAGCTAIVPVTIGEPNPCIDCKGFGLKSIVAVDAQCAQSNGELCTTVEGGTAPYTFTVKDAAGAVVGTTTSSNPTYCLTNLPAGSYSVVIVDATGVCSVNGNNDIENVGGPNVTLVGTPTNATCGQANGTANFNASIGLAPYAFMVTNEAGATVASGSSAGSIALTGLDNRML